MSPANEPSIIEDLRRIVREAFWEAIRAGDEPTDSRSEVDETLKSIEAFLRQQRRNGER